MDDFDGGECFDVEVGCGLSDGSEHVGVVVEGQPGVQAADDVHLGGAGVGGLLGGVGDLFDGIFVGAGLVFLAVEGAKFAAEGADVGVVEVSVDVVVGPAVVHSGADVVGELAERPDVVGLEEGEGVVGVESPAGVDFFGDGGEGGVQGGFCGVLFVGFGSAVEPVVIIG